MGARSAIVTGGAGFIGSHLVDALLAEGADVTVIDDLSSGNPDRLDPRARLVEIDVVDRAGLRDEMQRRRPEVVFHLAAQASVVASVEDPERDCEVNVRGTLNVVEAANGLGAPVVFTSTGGALYGDEAPRPTREDRIPAPLSPYGASKWAGESYVRTWSRLTGVPNAVCRLGNVYGSRQSPHGEAGVVSIFSLHLHRGTTPKLFGHGSPTRDYVHVADVVRALIAARGQAGVFNVSTGVETDVATVWRILCEASGSQVEPQLADLRAGELQHSCLDTLLAANELGWSAEIAVEEGLADTYRALVEGFEPAER